MSLLVDLDGLVSSVWDTQTKPYLQDAVLAYRVGAYRLAIVATWTAVAFDIINKIRGLAADGDNAAQAFIQTFDHAIASDNTSQLLKIERELVDSAKERFQLIGVQDAKSLRRLQDDRHLCAHPALSRDHELFSPPPDLVRAHIVQAANSVLAMPPLSGKAILQVYRVDVPSSAFPRERESAVRYVIDRYLNRMRASTVRNFSLVVLKAFIRSDVPEWQGFDNTLLDSLEAVQRFDAAYFRGEFTDRAVAIIDEATEIQLLRSLWVISRFPIIREKLRAPALSRLHALALTPTTHMAVFAAAGILDDEVNNALRERLETLGPVDAMTILQSFPAEQFADPTIEALEHAGSFRDAEARLRNVEYLITFLNGKRMQRVINAVAGNGQALHAVGTPAILARLLRAAQARHDYSNVDFNPLRMAEQHATQDYSGVWQVLRDAGLYV